MQYTCEEPALAAVQIEARPDASSNQPLEGVTFGLEVLAIHEDLPSGLRINDLLDNLSSQLEIKTAFYTSWYRFDMFADAELSAASMRQANRSNIVFLSLHGDKELPGPLHDWLLLWLETRGFQPCALVLSLDSSCLNWIKSNATCKLLRAMTTNHEVDLFLHFDRPYSTGKAVASLVNRHLEPVNWEIFHHKHQHSN